MKANELKLEVGKRYVRRDGEVTGPLVKLPNRGGIDYHHDRDFGCLYWDHGQYDLDADSPEDLIKELEIITINEQGDELPDASMMVVSSNEYNHMKETIELQIARIERLEAAIARKNKVFSEVMDMVRYELAKEIE